MKEGNSSQRALRPDERMKEEKPMNGEKNVAQLLEEREVGNAGRVLVVLKGMHVGEQAAVEEESFHSYMFLLNGYGIVPTNYRFVFEPLPFSSEMDGVMAYLSEDGFLSRESPLWIMGKGEEWVEQVLQEDENVILETIRECIAQWRGISRGKLFQEAYRVYVSR